jgi:hypothetical protein
MEGGSGLNNMYVETCRWITLVVYAWDDTRCVATDDLKKPLCYCKQNLFCLCAKYAYHWCNMDHSCNTIMITSLRITRAISLLGNGRIDFLREDFTHLIIELHIIQGHLG